VSGPSCTVANHTLLLVIVASPVPPHATTSVPDDTFPASRPSTRFQPLITRLQSQPEHRGVPCHRERLRRRGVPIPSRVLVLSQWRLVGVRTPPVPLTITLLPAIVASPVPPCATTNVPVDTFPASVSASPPAPKNEAAVTDRDTVVLPVTDNACVGAAFPYPEPCVALSQWRLVGVRTPPYRCQPTLCCS
jgi:hypothetical protein